MNRRRRNPLHGMAVALGVAAVLLGGASAAHGAVDATVAVDEATEATADGHTTTATLTWSVPDHTPSGTSFVLSGFGSDLDNPGSDVVSFVHPSTGALVATGTWAGNALNVTLTDFVTAHPLEIRGTVTLVSEVIDPREETPRPWYSPTAYECAWDPILGGEEDPACALTVGNGDDGREATIGRSIAKQSPDGAEAMWLTELQMPIQWPVAGEGIAGPVFVEYAALPGAPIDCSWNPTIYVYQDNSLGSPGGILDSIPFEAFPFVLEDVSCAPEGLSFTLPEGLPLGASFSVTVGGYVDTANPNFDFAKGYRWTNLEGAPAVEGSRSLSAAGTAQSVAAPPVVVPPSAPPATAVPGEAVRGGGNSPESLAMTGGADIRPAYAAVAVGLIVLGSAVLLWRRVAGSQVAD